jgi:hypothetical protein
MKMCFWCRTLRPDSELEFYSCTGTWWCKDAGACTHRLCTAEKSPADLRADLREAQQEIKSAVLLLERRNCHCNWCESKISAWLAKNAGCAVSRRAFTPDER